MKRALGLGLALLIGLGGLCGAGAGVSPINAHSQHVAGWEGLDYFDWRALGAVTPVRNQRGCAAGFAFAATAMLESAVARDTARRVDLSEQYLLNCAGVQDPCSVGEWTLLDQFHSVYLPPQHEAGAVLESVLPYRGKAGTCARDYPHPYRIDRWGYVNPAGATVEDLKQALLDHGPLGAALCAGPIFQNYRSGVYAADESATCRAWGLETNHALLITGWDDLRGCWLVKNAWGAGWGQAGYGCVQYGLPGVAENAVFLDYRAAPGVPALVSPGSGVVVKTRAPLLTWKPAPGKLDGYQLQIGADAAFTTLVLDVQAQGLSYLPEAELPANTRLYWRVRAWRGPLDEVLYGKWSAARNFKTLPAAPEPLWPIHNLVDSPRPTFTWGGPPDLRFDLQISRASTCERVLRSAVVRGLTFTPATDLPSASTLYWRVRARGLYGAGPWSACVLFGTL